MPFYAVLADCAVLVILAAQGGKWQLAISVVAGALTFWIAHHAGKPVWADHPFDASDLAMFALLGTWLLAAITKALAA